MTRFAGRRAVVTGAASGIGRAVARRLLDEGARVTALDVDSGGLDQLAAEASADVRDRLTVAIADVCDAMAVRASLRGDRTDAPAVDLLAHVAGVADTRHTALTSQTDWQRVIDIDLTGTFTVIQESLPGLLVARGAVVTVSSIAGISGRPYLAAYSAAKAGVIALTRSLAVEFAAAGVRFCSVAPGSVDTPLRDGLATVPGADAALLGRGRSLMDQTAATPGDIAAAVAFLGSSEARFITGAVLVVDGGALA